MSPTDSSFVEDLLAAPVGVALLGRLEGAHRDDVPWFACPSTCDREAVHRAAASIADLSYDELLVHVLFGAEWFVGPWSGEALRNLPYLYEQATLRRPIADAIADRFEHQLHDLGNLGDQQWWHEEVGLSGYRPPRCFESYDEVYGNGEFTRAGLWTVSDPPSAIHDALTLSWDFCGRTTSRWRFPVRPDARVWQIQRPRDWVRLVETYPKIAPSPHSGWELPGPNQYPSDTAMLRSLVQQHSVRTQIGPHVLPDWRRVAADFDGVHVSWAGFVTAEGFISDLPGAGVAMLRYWGSERTLWLNDVFGPATPLPAPALSGFDGGSGVDASIDEVRRQADRSIIEALLGH